MTHVTHLLVAVLFGITLAVSWVAQLLGLPGNWLIVAVAAGYAGWGPTESAADLGWHVVAALVALAVLGEIVELVAGAAGVSKRGGSRRGAMLAIAGSLVGSIVGMFVGLPIPFVGSLVAAVVFAALGALVGAMLGEHWKGRDFDASLEIGKAAFVGRLLGTVAKMMICSVMVAIALGALVV
jgi:uncharacterized protein YqgC (DUF456 family)